MQIFKKKTTPLIFLFQLIVRAALEFAYVIWASSTEKCTKLIGSYQNNFFKYLAWREDEAY